MILNKLHIFPLLIQICFANVEKIIFDLPIKADYSTHFPKDLEFIIFGRNINSHVLKVDSLPKDYLIGVDKQQEHGRYEIRLVNIATSPVDTKFREVCLKDTKDINNDNLTDMGNCFIILSLNQNNYVKNPSITNMSYIQVELVLDPMLKIFGIQTDIPKTALPTIWLIIFSLPIALLGFKPLLNGFIMDNN